MLACLSILLGGKKKKSKGFSKASDCSKKGSSNGDLRVKPVNHFNPLTENGIQDEFLTVSKSFPSAENGSFTIPKVPSDNTGEAAYEGGDEHDEILSMKREFSDLDIQSKGKLASHGSNTDLNSHVFESTETEKGFFVESTIAGGHASDPGVERPAFLGSPVLKRSCSNIETKQGRRWINSPKKSSSYCNLQNLPAKCRVDITFETHSSPLSVRTSCSADRVMLKRRSSSQVLPSRSRKIWWKLFLWSHRNLHKPRASPMQVSALSYSKQKDGYSSDTHEPAQMLDKKKKKSLEPDNQWVAFSGGSSHMDRVNAWIISLEDCSVFSVDAEEHCDGMEDEQTSHLHDVDIREFSETNCTHTGRRAADDVLQANNVVRSLNAFSSVAHISGIGLKVIPSISAFVSLRSVNLSGNCIVHIAPGSLPKSLHTLDLSRNKISTIEGLRDLEKLRVLNLSYNRITRIGHGLSSCTIIKELYLAGNKISNVEGLHRLLKLTVLDLSFNKITTAKALGQLVANYNTLVAVNLLGNPIQANIGDDHLRKAVSSLLPHVTYLNKQPIKPPRMREAVAESVARAALGDAARSSRRKMTRRLNNNSSSKRRFGEGSFMASSARAVKHGKRRHSTFGQK